MTLPKLPKLPEPPDASNPSELLKAAQEIHQSAEALVQAVQSSNPLSLVQKVTQDIQQRIAELDTVLTQPIKKR